MTTDSNFSKEQIAKKAARRFRKFTTRGKLGFDDLMQAARLGIHEAERTFDPDKGSFEAYAHRLATFSIYREVHNNGRTVRVPNFNKEVPFCTREVFDFDIVKSSGTIDPAQRRELHEAVVSKLTKRQLEIIQCFYFQDMTLTEIAAMHNVTVDGVYACKARALEVLRQALTDKNRLLS